MELFKKETGTATFAIVYNLHEPLKGLFVPTPYIVQKDRAGGLGYLQKRATPGTLASFGLATDAVHNQLFEIAAVLQTKALEERFRPNRRKLVSLEKLWEDPASKTRMERFVHKKMDTFLSLISSYKIPLCRDLERKTLAQDVLIQIPDNQELEPKIEFDLRERVIHYRLRLADENGDWEIREHEVVPLVYEPAWLLVDYRLHRVPHINGKMVRPFCQKEKIVIPLRAAKTYFETFILKIAARLDIETSGFEVVKNDDLSVCELYFTQNIFSGKWGL
ncbi:MAG: hypothetical protein D6714_04530, partial [Bacteroidetes bacterium]